MTTAGIVKENQKPSKKLRHTQQLVNKERSYV